MDVGTRQLQLTHVRDFENPRFTLEIYSLKRVYMDDERLRGGKLVAFWIAAWSAPACSGVGFLLGLLFGVFT